LLPERNDSRNPLIILFSLLSGGNPNSINEQTVPILSEIILEYEDEETEDSVKILLLAGANPNASDTILDETALHCAVYIQNRTFIHMLLEYGANPNIENRRNQTAMDIARVLIDSPYKNLRNAPKPVKDSFQESSIEEFQSYCNAIKDDLKSSKTVYSIVEQFKLTKKIANIIYLL
ncbi:ankyrin repeat domain-containing protein, partial [Candidatus Babeliales bacterium]|nr:ankyrin repeat domain-containing protein [Candidatus Babeliales bacterium]